MMAMLMMFFALLARGSGSHITAEITFQSRASRTGRAGSGLDAVLLKELDGASTHATTEHHVDALLLDETGNLTGLVGGIIGVINHVDVLNLAIFDIGQNKIRATPKVVGDGAVQSIIAIC